MFALPPIGGGSTSEAGYVSSKTDPYESLRKEEDEYENLSILGAMGIL